MKKLTKKEIKFIKETGWTPTLHQMNYCESEVERVLKRYPVAFHMPEDGDVETAYLNLSKIYGINIHKLYNKTCSKDNWDSISLEYEATYLLYTFFPVEDLMHMDYSWALEWLKDFKYYLGFRKWSENDVENAILEALQIYAGSRKLYRESDGNIWNKEIKLS